MSEKLAKFPYKGNTKSYLILKHRVYRHQDLRIFFLMWICVFVHVSESVCMCVRVYMCVRVCVHACVRENMCVRECTCVSVSVMCDYKRMYVYESVCICVLVCKRE